MSMAAAPPTLAHLSRAVASSAYPAPYAWIISDAQALVLAIRSFSAWM